MQNILVIFQATTQHTESLALAIGLGAVQHGANIRLRHLDPSPGTELAHGSYGILQGSDLDWAEGVAIVLEGESLGGLDELRACFETLQGNVGLSKKLAFVSGDQEMSQTVQFIRELVAAYGLKYFSDEHEPEQISLESLNRVGQRLAEMPAE